MELNRITFLEGGIVYGLPSIVPFVLEPDRIKLMDLLQARFKTFGGPPTHNSIIPANKMKSLALFILFVFRFFF